MSDPSVVVTVLLFDVLRQRVGRGTLAATVAAGSTATDLLDQLAREHASVAEHRPVTRLAVNGRYAPADTVLAEGDEVALITPVSGG